MDAQPSLLLTLVYWSLLLPVSGLCLQVVCNMCGADAPSVRRGAVITVFVTAAAFLVFDLAGYGIFMGTRDVTQVQVPPDYSYLQWLREPLYLKWQVLSLIPMLRYLLLGIAGCLAAVLYVLILQAPFRNCVVIFVGQWFLTVVAMAVLSFAFTVTWAFLGGTRGTPAEMAGAGTVTTTPAYQARLPRAATRPSWNRQQVKPVPAAGTEVGAQPGTLQQSLLAYQAAVSPFLEKLRLELDAVAERLDPRLEPIRLALAPLTKQLPPAAQEFLDDGGWWLVLAAVAAIALAWLRHIIHRLRHLKAVRRQRARKDPWKKRRIDLDAIGDASTEAGPVQITVRDFPGRLRVVVLAPAASYVGELLPDMAPSLLDWLRPSLGNVVDYDAPRVEVWPPHASQARFEERFYELVAIPDARGRKTQWILMTGAATVGRQTLFVGLGVYLDRGTHMREVRIGSKGWEEIVGLQAVQQPV